MVLLNDRIVWINGIVKWLTYLLHKQLIICWLVGMLIELRLTDWVISLIYWIIDLLMPLLADWLNNWLTCWLTDFRAD